MAWCLNIWGLWGGSLELECGGVPWWVLLHEWIWTTDTLNDDEVFFRYTIGGTPPSSGGAVTVTADNAYEVFVNGVSVGIGSDWYTAGVFLVGLATGDVVGIHAIDAGGIAGLLAEVAWDGGSAVSDGSWRCRRRVLWVGLIRRLMTRCGLVPQHMGPMGWLLGT